MKIPGVRVLVPVLVGTLFAACSPTRLVPVDRASIDYSSIRYCSINGNLHHMLNAGSDTLSCLPMLQKGGTMGERPEMVTVHDEIAASIPYTQLIDIVVDSSLTAVLSGDTLQLPVKQIMEIRLVAVNAGFVLGALGMIIVAVPAVLMIIQLTRHPWFSFQ